MSAVRRREDRFVGVVGVALLLLLLVHGCAGKSANVVEAAAGAAAPSPRAAPRAGESSVATLASGDERADAVTFELFVMSQCPYGVQAFDALKPALEQLGAAVDFDMNFIGEVNERGGISSMHGPNEITGDIVQLCAKHIAPAAFLDMIACQNKSAGEVATNWQGCAGAANISVSRLRDCLEGPRGMQLIKESFALSKTRGAVGCPTMFVAGELYEGRRGTADFLRAICRKQARPEEIAACRELPPAPITDVVVLGDRRCPDCDASGVLASLKVLLAAPAIRALDYSEQGGKELYASLGGGPLPLILLNDTLRADSEAYERLKGYLRPLGGMSYLPVGARWLPACVDEGGCTRAECRDTLVCRRELPKKLDLFVMSQCPFCVRALTVVPELLERFGADLDFSMHYLASGDAAHGFVARHGDAEVEENIRQLCAMHHFGKSNKYLDYVLCRNEEVNSADWQKCTSEHGIDSATIERCATGSLGKKLLEEDIKLSAQLNIEAAPTWVANNKFKFSGLDFAAVRSAFCEHNARLGECAKELSPGSTRQADGTIEPATH